MRSNAPLSRRGLLQALIGGSFGCGLLHDSVGVASAQGLPTQRWPQFGYNSHNTAAPAESEHSGPTGEVTQQWSFSPEYEIGSSSFRSSPAVIFGDMYVVNGSGEVLSLDVSDGIKNWGIRRPAGDTLFPPVTSPLAVGNCNATRGAALVPELSTPCSVYFGTDQGAVKAVDTSDGTEQWSFETGDSIRSGPTIDGMELDESGTLFVGSDDNSVYALDVTDGTKQWSFQTLDSVRSSPAVREGTLYFGSDSGNVYALNDSDGTEQWSFGTGDSVRSAPAVANGTVYVGSDDGNVYALATSDGAEQWTFDTGDSVRTSPAVANGTVYVGSADNRVYALNALNGTEQWSYDTRGAVYSSPVVVDDTVYVGSDFNNVYALDTSNGAEEWVFQTGDAVRSSPVVVYDRVYVGSTDGTLYALSGQHNTPTATPTTSGTDTTTSTVTNATAPTGGQSRPGIVPIALGILGLGGAGGAGAWWIVSKGDDGDGGDRSGDTAATRTDDELGASDRVSTPDQTTSPSVGNHSPQSSTGSTPRAAPSDGKIPTRIPSAPKISVEYDALTNRDTVGGGGNADVTKAVLSTPDGHVPLAIKEPRFSGTLHADQVERMLDEAERWNKLDDHDHIVDVVDYGSQPVPWIAMEYMDGGHLGSKCSEMQIPQALWTALGVTNGVRHAHTRGVAHLDLKPENILFRTVEDAWDVPKVADWGLSRHLLEHSKSVEGMSPHYAAPEQFEKEYGPANNVTDVYQLGAVFYELFTGQPPFEGRPTQVMRSVMDKQPTPPSEVADIPEALDEILLTALAKEKDDRYGDILYLRDDLQQLYDSLSATQG